MYSVVFGMIMGSTTPVGLSKLRNGKNETKLFKSLGYSSFYFRDCQDSYGSIWNENGGILMILKCIIFLLTVSSKIVLSNLKELKLLRLDPMQ